MNRLVPISVLVISIFTVVPAIAGRYSTKDCAVDEKLVEHVAHCNYNNTDCSVSFKMGTCLSCETSTCSIILGTCLFDLVENSSLEANLKSGKMLIKQKLPTSCQDLEERMCGAMNREGFLCSQCKSGYGPAPYSGTFKCFECNDNSSTSRWLLYIALELLPSTAFYMIVLFFNIRITSPPYTAFIFFSQFFALLYKIQPFIRLSLNLVVNKMLLQGVLTLVSFWNLDFFRHVVPPFCISSKLTDLHSLLLDLISAFYPLFLVILTLVLIELHARNCRPIVILWKPFHKCFANCRRKLDSTSSVITASATFITLAFSKILVTAFLAVFPGVSIQGEHVKLRALYDPNIFCNSSNSCYSGLVSTPYFFPLLIMLLIVHLPTLLLLVYPIRCFRRIFSFFCSSKFRAIYVFVDTFQGHYKDGTNGSRDYRAASSISFLLRTLFCFILGNTKTRAGLPVQSNNYLSLIFLLTVTSLFYGLIQPCKKKYMNIVECVVYSAAGLILLSLGTGHGTGSFSHSFNIVFELDLSLVFVILPSVILLILSISKVFSCLCCCRCRRVQRVRNALLSDQELPDRITHPQDYEPLN